MNEVGNTSILKTGLFPRYPRSLPSGYRSGRASTSPLSRSDLVPWPIGEDSFSSELVRFLGLIGRKEMPGPPDLAGPSGAGRGGGAQDRIRRLDRFRDPAHTAL